jgi:hypothetical protein
MTWKLEDGTLSYNQYEVETEYDTKDQNALELKISPNGKYASVCNINSFYADFYKLIDDDENSQQIPKYMYSLRRNTYRTSNTRYLLEFFNSQDITMFIFNSEHGIISVHDVETGKVLHNDECEDKFITDYTIIDNKYLYIIGWFWTPIHFTALYKISDLITVKDCESVKINCEPIDTDKEDIFKLNNDNMIEIMNETHPLHNKYTLDDFYNNHVTIKKLYKDIELTENIINNKNNLFHNICNDKYLNVMFLNNSRIKLNNILSSSMTYDINDIIQSSCVGNLTGNNLYLNEFTSNITYNDTSLNYLIPRIISRGFISRFTDLNEINLNIKLQRNDITVEVLIEQQLSKILGTENLYEVDRNKLCYITVK